MQAGTELDDALIDACRGGDRDAFARIIERYHRAVYAVAFSTARDRAIADDVTQDAFVTAWRRLGELRDPRRLPAWLCGIARNLARDACKRRRRETADDGIEPVHATTPYDAMSDLEAEWLIATALGQVPDVYREPLVLYYYEDRSVEDVARALGITAATTNKRLSRGRKYLAERVAVVERGLARRGPPAALATSVLAIIGVTVPASHVEASTVKGSTMHKLAIAAAVTVAIGGVTAAGVVAATRDGNAHAGTTAATTAPTTTSATAARAPAAGGAHSCDLLAALAQRTKQPARAAGAAAADAPGIAANAAPPDCEAVGRHLADLEADMTHGPDDRPDETTGETCAGYYTAQCASEDWSAERRACALAAADLVNAHLCADAPAPAEAPPAIPPALACPVLGEHLASVTRSAGMYVDVTDMHDQIAAACELGAWSLDLRQCFAAATTLDAVKTCIAPLLD